ncbi:hypothetical protein K402DRAFT_131006 [Aulographum hederae CBS 113979]|uniref:Uncharacterized protein n=1 Tax=Aulographum hederae CBS 113979 TaxID=1176131 RepID=A0A6G1HF40_9PEZI|nr:hypothetical protein K402DRAFT_131006 [Aulographum hederae CBS 113979]
MMLCYHQFMTPPLSQFFKQRTAPIVSGLSLFLSGSTALTHCAKASLKRYQYLQSQILWLEAFIKVSLSHVTISLFCNNLTGVTKCSFRLRAHCWNSKNINCHACKIRPSPLRHSSRCLSWRWSSW